MGDERLRTPSRGGHPRCRYAVLPYFSQTMIAQVNTILTAAAAGGPASLFPQRLRATPWDRFEVQELACGVGCDEPAAGEEVGYLLLSGQVGVSQADVDGEQYLSATAPSVVCCAIGAHRLQAGPSGARFIRFAVDAKTPSGGQLRSDELTRDRLPWREAIHGGGGRIGTRHLWRPEEFTSSLTFVDHAVLSKGSSLGCHYHDFLEEAFVVLSGRGWMSFVGADPARPTLQTVEIGPGDVTWQAANVGHGLYNPFAEDLEFVRIAVAAPDADYTTVDLDNDMRQCRPTQEAP